MQLSISHLSHLNSLSQISEGEQDMYGDDDGDDDDEGIAYGGKGGSPIRNASLSPCKYSYVTP